MQLVFDLIKNNPYETFIYGTGDGADKLIDYLTKIGVEIDGICVSDEFYRKRIFRGFEIQPIGVVSEKHKNALFLMAFGVKNTDEIFKLSKKINLLYPEMPVCENVPFTKETFLKDKDIIEKAYSLLADEESKKVFESILRFRLSGDIEYLKQCESSIEDGYGIILDKTKKETVFDCGAYTGDTAADFEKYSGGLNWLYAAEPCPKSFLKLKEKYGRYSVFNCAIGKKEGEAEFVFSRGRGSALASNQVNTAGKITKVPVRSVDGILSGNECSVIKYDVEGEEENALMGSEKTINSNHPKLLVAAYHRMDDIYKIPLLIKRICEGYNIYLRHHPCLPSWETNVYALYKTQ